MIKGSLEGGDWLEIVRTLNPRNVGFGQRERKVMTTLTFPSLNQICHSLIRNAGRKGLLSPMEDTTRSSERSKKK